MDHKLVDLHLHAGDTFSILSFSEFLVLPTHHFSVNSYLVILYARPVLKRKDDNEGDVREFGGRESKRKMVEL